MFNTIQEADVEVRKFMKDLRNAMKSNKDEASAITASGSQITYKALDDAFGLHAKLIGKASVYAQALSNAGVAAAKEGGNPYGPTVRLLFRRSKKGGGTEPNPSAWKYANVLRYCEDKGLRHGQLVNAIPGFEETIDGSKKTKLLAAELKDRERYGDDKEAIAIRAAAFVWQSEQTPLGTLSGADLLIDGREDGQWVSIAARWDEASSSYNLHRPIDTNSESVMRAITKGLVSDFRAYHDTLLRELAEHNIEMDDLDALSDDEKAHIRAVAKRTGMTPAKWMLEVAVMKPAQETTSKRNPGKKAESAV